MNGDLFSCDPAWNLLTNLVGVWKIQDSMFEGWGEDGWQAQDLNPDAKLNAGGRWVYLLRPGD
jgi:hypothetical protein